MKCGTRIQEDQSLHGLPNDVWMFIREYDSWIEWLMDKLTCTAAHSVGCYWRGYVDGGVAVDLAIQIFQNWVEKRGTTHEEELNTKLAVYIFARKYKLLYTRVEYEQQTPSCVGGWRPILSWLEDSRHKLLLTRVKTNKTATPTSKTKNASMHQALESHSFTNWTPLPAPKTMNTVILPQ